VNLHEFLKLYQVQVPLSERGYLWIDQLCINQDDPVEKSSQVQMMALIYRNAIEVISWLGPPNEHTGRAVWLLDLLQDDWTLLYKAQPLYRGRFLSGSMLQAYKDLVRLAARRRDRANFNSIDAGVVLGGKTRIAIWDFFSNPYWIRLWIVQEIMLARSLTIWWGEHRISRQALEGLSRNLSITYKDTVCRPWLKLDSILNHGLSQDSAIGFDQPTSVDSELSYLVRLFSTSECQDRRDKVFGLMALVRAETVITIDYSKSAEDVYLETVRAMGLDVVVEAKRQRFDLEHRDWESYISTCYVLGVEMLPDKFASLPSELSYDITDAARLMGFDQEQLLTALPVRERGQYMSERLAAFLGR
jgi:hypothetical protein